MAKIKNRRTMPPGGVWSYWDPDLEQHLEHRGLLEDFPLAINQARVRNGLSSLPEDELLQKIEDHICEQFSHLCDEAGSKPRYRPLTINNIANFTRTLAAVCRAKAEGRDVYNPDPKSAAKVCADCPLNQKRLCSTCTGLEAVARRVLRAQQTTPYDRVLGACNACGCMLRVKVHFAPEILREATRSADRERYPQDYPCWIWQESGKD